jgi:hypothetical protein
VKTRYETDLDLVQKTTANQTYFLGDAIIGIVSFKGEPRQSERRWTTWKDRSFLVEYRRLYSKCFVDKNIGGIPSLNGQASGILDDRSERRYISKL